MQFAIDLRNRLVIHIYKNRNKLKIALSTVDITVASTAKDLILYDTNLPYHCTRKMLIRIVSAVAKRTGIW